MLFHCNKRSCSASHVTCLPARWPPVFSRCFAQRHSSGLNHNANTTGCSSLLAHLLETLSRGSSNNPCNQSANTRPSAVGPAQTFVVNTVSCLNIIQNKGCNRREVEENLLSLSLIKLGLRAPCAYVTNHLVLFLVTDKPPHGRSLSSRAISHTHHQRANRARVAFPAASSQF